jgi:hypothetical protein
MTMLTAWAQENVNMKFGKPTKEELAMTTYEADPQADAVVLCRLTDVEYTVQSTTYLIDYHEKVRIKVLKPSGARFAKVVIPYQQHMAINSIGGTKITAMALPKPGGSSDSYFEGEGVSMTEGVFGVDSDEDVEDIKATAFNMEGGKVVKTFLKKSDIVKTKIDEQNYLVEFTVPNVKEGTVIEYEYNIHSQLFWQLRDWYAQCEIPVVYAKLDMNIPSYLIYNIEDHGIQRLTYTCTAGSMKFKLVSDPLSNPMTITTNHYVYIGRNLRGMPKDDYVWNIQDYCAGITAELKTYRLPGMSQMDFAKTWQQIDELILGSDAFNLQLNAHSPLHQELQDAHIQDIANVQERAAAVYRLVTSRVKWNGKYDLWPQPTKEILQQGTGNNADINMMLIQSLKDVGLESVPVVLRSRDQGMLPYNFPSFQKLTTYVVGIKQSNGQYAYVDASSTGGWLNVLPATLLTDRARLVNPKGSTWVDLQKTIKAKTVAAIEATLSADGTIQGTQTTQYEGLAAQLFRQQQHSTEFAQKAMDSTTVNYKGTVANGQITFCPFPTPPIQPRPFATEDRLMPVEFPSLSSEMMTVNITLPEGYVLVDKPEQYNMVTTDKGVEGRLFVSQMGQKLQIHYLFNVNKVKQDPKNYPAIRQMFETFTNFGKTLLVVKPES